MKLLSKTRKSGNQIKNEKKLNQLKNHCWLAVQATETHILFHWWPTLYFFFKVYHQEFLSECACKGLLNPSSLSIAGEGTPVVTSAREEKHPVCGYNQYFSQPDCDIGWDFSRDCFYYGATLYMIVAPNSSSDLSIFSLLNPASMHVSRSFLKAYFSMTSFLLDFTVNKWL